MSEVTSNDHDIRCPYCEKEQTDSWEYLDGNMNLNDFECECDFCNEKFTCFAESTITYTSVKKK